jgi:hypothetical protein
MLPNDLCYQLSRDNTLLHLLMILAQECIGCKLRMSLDTTRQTKFLAEYKKVSWFNNLTNGFLVDI